MHELPVQVEEGPERIEGKSRGELDDARDHERRDLSGRPGHGENQPREDRGHDGREDDPPGGLELRGAEGERRFPEPAGNGGESLLRGDDHDGEREKSERERRPEDAARSERGRGERFGIEEAVDRPADEVDEEPHAEDAEDDRRHAGQIVHGDPHGADERSLLRVLPKVERGEDAQGRRDEAHDHDHHDRPEDRGEDAPFGVRFPRVVRDELPDLCGVEGGFGPRPHNVGAVGSDDLREREFLFLAAHGGDDDADRVLLPVGREGRLLFRVHGLQGVKLTLETRGFGAFSSSLRGELLDLEADLLLGMVDSADLRLLDPPDLGQEMGGLRKTLLEGVPAFFAAADSLPVLADLLERSVEVSPLAPLDHDRVVRPLPADDPRFIHPREVLPIDVPVPLFDLNPVFLRRSGRGARLGDLLPLHHLSHDGGLVVQDEEGDVLRPEEPEAVREDQQDETRHHEEGEGEPSRREPDERIAALPEILHR